MAKKDEDRILREELLKNGAKNKVLFQVGEELDELLLKLGYRIDVEDGDLFLSNLNNGDVDPLHEFYIDGQHYVKLDHLILLEGEGPF